MKRILSIGLVLICISVLFVGCNLFGNISPDDPESENRDGLEALRDGNYEEAIEIFLEVLDEDQNNAEAHWGLSKAYLRQSGYTTVGIMVELTTFSTHGAFLPFMAEPVDSANALYEGVIKSNYHLSKIFYEEVTNEELNKETVCFDYAGTMALQGILLLRDTNGSGHIGDGDIDLMAQFDLAGEFLMNPDAWDNLPQAEKDSLYAMLDELLNSSGEALEYFANNVLADSTGFDLGFDIENFDIVIDDILFGFEDFTGYGGGGPTPEGMLKPDDQKDFIGKH